MDARQYAAAFVTQCTLSLNDWEGSWAGLCQCGSFVMFCAPNVKNWHRRGSCDVLRPECQKFDRKIPKNPTLRKIRFVVNNGPGQFAGKELSTAWPKPKTWAVGGWIAVRRRRVFAIRLVQ